MNTQETIIQLKELKLKGMANTLESLMTLPVQSRPSFDFAIANLVLVSIGCRPKSSNIIRSFFSKEVIILRKVLSSLDSVIFSMNRFILR